MINFKLRGERGFTIFAFVVISLLSLIGIAPLVLIFIAVNDMRGLFFLLGIVFGIIIKKDIVSRKLASFFEKFWQNLNEQNKDILTKC